MHVCNSPTVDKRHELKPVSMPSWPWQGIDSSEGDIQLISDVIHKMLHIDMSVLMGANLARDVAKEDFCEATIGTWDWKCWQTTCQLCKIVQLLYIHPL